MRLALLLWALGGIVFTADALNILPNHSFEFWMDTIGVHLPVGWLSSELLYPGSAVKDSLSNSGNYCVHLIGGDTSAFITTATLVRAGFHYEFSGYAYVPGVIGGSFVLQFLNWRGSPIGTPNLLPLYHSSGYRCYSNWITAPDSAVFLSVSCVTLPAAQLYVDDVVVDDTTLTGINELSEIKEITRTRRNKMVVFAPGCAPGIRGQIFDATGRRVHHRAIVPGVYFVIEDGE